MHKIEQIIWCWKCKSWQILQKKQEDVITQLHIEVQFQRQLIETNWEQMKQNLKNEVKRQIVGILEELSTSESPTNSSAEVSSRKLFYSLFSFRLIMWSFFLKPKYHFFYFYLIYFFIFICRIETYEDTAYCRFWDWNLWRYYFLLWCWDFNIIGSVLGALLFLWESKYCINVFDLYIFGYYSFSLSFNV